MDAVAKPLRLAEPLVVNWSVAISVARYIDHPLADGIAPPWASGWGEDRYGPWVALTVGEATQRLKWIPPGIFKMGVARGEEHHSWETVGQREVIIETGFWIFDTPCTQALWVQVMGGNPSGFQEGEWQQRPVERVSWEDCQEFLKRLNGRLDGLTLELPSEAQWEYACRAGTKGVRYDDDIDRIAWYDKNSGGETHAVGKLQANQWGVFDMLGNVFEWCRDRYESKGDQATNRVIRGGSWNFDPQRVRSAYRGGYLPVIRIHYLGFRCSSSAAGELAPGQ